MEYRVWVGVYVMFYAQVTLLSPHSPVSVCVIAASYVFDAVAVSGDFLLVAFQVMSPVEEEVGREYLAMNLNSGKVDSNYKLVSNPKALSGVLVQYSTVIG